MTTELKTKNAKAVIASEGAELKSLVIGGREIMWCGDPAFLGKDFTRAFSCDRKCKKQQDHN